ncbi:MAG: hypothetical protein NPIRA02_29430 [Nitrospirales bacterium]|nr:MAG: hypothetical protein NPIRA02_29430 [Nitrospirales bacterium]
MWKYLMLLSSLTLLNGCALITGQSLSDSLDEMRTTNKTGCVKFLGSGTPPASRVDLTVISTWGEEVTFKDCVEVLRQAP